MPAQVKKLIAELKRAHPELQDEPLLDEISDAAYGEGEADEAETDDMSDIMGDLGDMGAAEDDMAGLEEDAPAEDEEAMPPPPKFKKKPPPRM